MPKTKIDKEALAKEYTEKAPLYDKMGKNLLGVIAGTLSQMGVELYGVSYRVKDFESFRDKAERGGFAKPFEQGGDICGIRIVHYYKSDMPKIAHFISQVTEIVAGEDIAQVLQTDRFGFRSMHFVVKLKKELLANEAFAGMEGMLAEIQVRTAVMETWANIMGKLAYEKKEHIPEDFQRKFYQLNAFFDLADDTFDELRREKENYVDKITRKAKKKGGFDPNLPMNLDNLQAFLDVNFPKRKKNLKVVSWLLVNIILQHNISMKALVEAYNKVKPHLPEIEKGLADLLKETYFFKEKEFERTQGIMLMTILSLTSDNYWLIISNMFDERYWEKLLQFFHGWRGKVNNKS